MSDFIERQAAIDIVVTDALSSALIYGRSKAGIEARKAIVDGLMRLPSSRVAEKLGEWLDHQNGIWIYAKCSKCESVHDVKSKYCPTCGAKMKMEGDDDLS